MKKTKEQKAITLVALIITIIVLLILAVVAIRAVTGDGIITHAKNAQTEYEEAQAKENSTISYYQTYLDTQGQVGKWIQNKTKLTRVNEDGTVDELEVGDLIENYKSETNGEIKWKVLGAENGNVLLVSASNVATKQLEGKEGYLNGVEILNDVTKGYDDGIGAVANSTRSINVEDINRVTGYNPLKTGTGEIYYKEDYGKVTQYLNRVTFTLGEDTNDVDGDGNTTEDRIYYVSEVEPETASGASKYVDKYQKFENIDGTVLVKESEYRGTEGTAKSITVQNNFYGYYPTSLTNDSSNATVNGISEDSMAYDLLFAGTEDESNYYWLGSSFVLAYDGYVWFGMHYVNSSYVGGRILWRSCDGAYSPTRGVRAVVSLQSDVQFKSSGEHIYTISIT